MYLHTLGTTLVKKIAGVKLLVQKNLSNMILVNVAKLSSKMMAPFEFPYTPHG